MAIADLLKKKEALYAAGAVVAALLASYFLVLTPGVRELKRLQAEVAAKQAESAESLRQWEEVRRDGGVRSGQWAGRLRTWEERLPEGPQTERFLAELGALAVRHNLFGFHLAVPSENDAATAGDLSVAAAAGAGGAGAAGDNAAARPALRYEVAFRSSYRDMASFVDDLPRMRRLVAIHRLTVKEKDGEMETKVDLSAYYRGTP